MAYNPAPHTYASPGTYSVSVIAERNNCPPKTVTKFVEVPSRPPPPVCNAVANFEFEATDLTVVFNNTSTGPEGLSFAWDFGDGNSSSEAFPTHTYAEAGNYNVTLTVSYPPGSSCQPVSVSKEVTVF